jgi:hypothetical protein
MGSADLEREWDEKMLEIYLRARGEAGYLATRFLRMLMERKGLATAKCLIGSPKPSEGFLALLQRKRLDLTVEAYLVENPKFHRLFTADDVEWARTRLAEHGYFAPDGRVRMPKTNV